MSDVCMCRRGQSASLAEKMTTGYGLVIPGIFPFCVHMLHATVHPRITHRIISHTIRKNSSKFHPAESMKTTLYSSLDTPEERFAIVHRTILGTNRISECLMSLI